MNPRLELFCLLFLIAIALILLIKSRRFTRFVNWLSGGTPPESPDELRRIKTNLDKTKADLTAQAAASAAKAAKDQADLNSL